jgi:hypothetical protein
VVTFHTLLPDHPERWEGESYQKPRFWQGNAEVAETELPVFPYVGKGRQDKAFILANLSLSLSDLQHSAGGFAPSAGMS